MYSNVDADVPDRIDVAVGGVLVRGAGRLEVPVTDCRLHVGLDPILWLLHIHTININTF
jgi:hypothetical protein